MEVFGCGRRLQMVALRYQVVLWFLLVLHRMRNFDEVAKGLGGFVNLW
jgi:hypothetical protein